MKYLIIWAILLYQRVAPPSIRERCIFKVSCSNYVLEGAREVGALEALKRFRHRTKCCRPGYKPINTQIADHEGLFLLRLRDGSIAEEKELSKRLRAEFGLPESEINEIN